MESYVPSELISEKRINFIKKSKASYIIKILHEVYPYSARIVGGAIRDAILNIELHDFDIATSLLPNVVVEILQSKGIKVVNQGIRFGTVIAVFADENIEITTLRRDIKCYGRHAEVKFTSEYKIDAERRDFTFNALTYCIVQDKIFDYFCGVQDLSNKKIRFIGNTGLRIKEDYLRVMRFFRFASIYNFFMDEKDLFYCKSNLDLMIKNVSFHRIILELDLIIVKSTNLFHIFNIINDSKFFLSFFPVLNISISSIFKKLNFFLNNFVSDSKTFIYDDLYKKCLYYAGLFFFSEVKVIKSSLKEKHFSKKSISIIVNLIKNSKHLGKLTTLYWKCNFRSIFSWIWFDLKDNFYFLCCNIILHGAYSNANYEDIIVCINYFKSRKRFSSPFTAKDILPHVKDKSCIKDYVKEIDLYWLKSGFSLSKNDLSEYFFSVILKKTTDKI